MEIEVHHASKYQEELQEKFEQEKGLIEERYEEELLEKDNKLKELEVALQEMYNNRGESRFSKAS